MSRARVDTFVMVINFIGENWHPIHVIIGLFEVHNPLGVDMVKKSRPC
jgi:hypothetical protein